MSVFFSSEQWLWFDSINLVTELSFRGSFYEATVFLSLSLALFVFGFDGFLFVSHTIAAHNWILHFRFFLQQCEISPPYTETPSTAFRYSLLLCRLFALLWMDLAVYSAVISDFRCALVIRSMAKCTHAEIHAKDHFCCGVGALLFKISQTLDAAAKAERASEWSPKRKTKKALIHRNQSKCTNTGTRINDRPTNMEHTAKRTKKYAILSIKRKRWNVFRVQCGIWLYSCALSRPISTLHGILVDTTLIIRYINNSIPHQKHFIAFSRFSLSFYLALDGAFCSSLFGLVSVLESESSKFTARVYSVRFSHKHNFIFTAAKYYYKQQTGEERAKKERKKNR